MNSRNEIKRVEKLLKIIRKFEKYDIDYLYPTTIINSFNFTDRQLLKFLKAYLKQQLKLRGHKWPYV